MLILLQLGHLSEDSIHDVFNHRAKMNSLASKGEWSQSLEI